MSSQTQTQTPVWRRIGAGVLIAVGAAFTAVILYAFFIILTGNFHAVERDEVFRSAQPSGQTIASYQQRHHIRSIINLRGENTGSPWYDEEVAAARRLGIRHIDFRMSSKKELTQAEAEQLIELMRTAPKPLLIHCQSGSDRTGLASALYVAAVKRWGEAAAESQLSIRYGHVAAPFARGWAMSTTFEAMEPALGYEAS